jgi:hypothetical protein
VGNEAVVTVTGETWERLRAKVIYQDFGCWEWTGAHTSGGYATMSIRERYVVVHRLLYHLFRGPIPDELMLDHLCHNRGCVRPDHLEMVTAQENASYERRQHHNELKKVCPRSHAYTPENTITTVARHGGESRTCRTCMSWWNGRRYDLLGIDVPEQVIIPA